MQQFNKTGFVIGSLLSLITAVVYLALSFMHGLKESFLMFNGNGGSVVDLLFRYVTYFGDALLWIPMLAHVIWKKRKSYLPMVTASFISVIILVQVCKFFIIPDEPRPLKFITDGSFIHVVEGVEAKMTGSFPSSHTATAFTFFLMICLIYRRKWWIVVGFLTASLVGYSRIYLAHHFPVDVAAGIIAAIISVALSIPFQRWIDKRNMHNSDDLK